MQDDIEELREELHDTSELMALARRPCPDGSAIVHVKP